MSATILTLRANPSVSIDMTGLTPDRLNGLDARAIAALEVAAGKSRLSLETLFEIQAGSGDLIIKGATPRLLNLGGGMQSGQLTVEGQAGDYAGENLAGGEIRFKGDVAAYAGCGMTGGRIIIEGNAGDYLGAARPGQLQGMKGGQIIVHGNCGERAGDRMRRGMLLIHGNTGAYCASRMLAGSIIVRGKTGAATGQGMKRGTLLVHHLPDLAATFNDCGLLPQPWLGLLKRSLAADPLTAPFAPAGTRARRLLGDLGNGGKGEILVIAE